MSELTIEQAVDLLYRGRSNVPKAAAAAGVSCQEIKAALEDRVKRSTGGENLREGGSRLLRG